MPSVVHLLPSLGWGGVERIACTMHQLARDAGWASRIDAPRLDVLDEGLARDAGERSPGSVREYTLRAWALGARARVRDERPDVVHAHLPYPDRVAATVLAAAGRPLVVTFGLLPERGSTWSLDEVLRVRSDRVLAVAARLVRHSRFVAVSAGDAEVLQRLIPTRRVVHVANAPPLPPRARADVPEVRWPESAARLLSVGRLHRQKGFDLMVAALAREPLCALPWHWVVAGDGEERGALAAAVYAAGLTERVTFAGAYPGHLLYAAADLVLSPSRWEGMPLVPMEAVEAGVPLLASAIAPHRELFASVPDTLLPDAPEQWPDAVARLVRSPDARAHLANAQRAVLPAEPRRTMWEAYEALYRAVTRE